MRFSLNMIGVVLIVILALPASSSCGQGIAEDQENKQCLKCHGEHGSVKKFPDGDFISTYVDADALALSVHRSLKCTACHKEFSDQRHPDRAFRTKLQFRIKESHGCRDCHAEEALKSRAIHEALFKKETAGEALVCTNCHSAHAVTHIAGGNVSKSEEQYCLRCHATEKHMSFKSGETLSVRVSVSELRDSPHRNVGCSDCHFGFSADDHPRMQFRSERQYRLAASEICRRCHYDMYSKASEGIHYAMLSVGKLEAPTCIDCHGGHAVTSLGSNRLGIVQKCKSCHARVYEVYARSVHGGALLKENNKDVPTCVDCHSSHSIKAASSSDFRETLPDTCGKCHSNGTIMGKYGLSTDVVKTYLSDFHGVTIGFYKNEQGDGQKRYQPDRPMAVCTDCHGTHDIASVSGIGAQTFKKTLQKRCLTCHSNASENFPDAWISHYKPSLANAPLVFIAEQFYGIMMPLMVIGLLFQIFLHIWRYLVNR
jgi:cytochrome c1